MIEKAKHTPGDEQPISAPQPTGAQAHINLNAEAAIERPRVNVISASETTGLISNFATTPFELDGNSFASIEGFVQFIKYPPTYEGRDEIAQMVGAQARRAGHAINSENFAKLDAGESVVIYWQDQEIPYRSEAHFDLIERAIRAKFAANPAAAAQLLQTGDAVLHHDTGHPENPHTSLPAEVFCRILISARDALSSSPR